MASKRVATLSDESKALLADELRERLRVAALAQSGLQSDSIAAACVQAMMTGLPFVVEELHRQESEQRVTAKAAAVFAREGVPYEGPMRVHPGPTGGKHADTPQERAKCPNCLKEAKRKGV